MMNNLSNQLTKLEEKHNKIENLIRPTYLSIVSLEKKLEDWKSRGGSEDAIELLEKRIKDLKSTKFLWEGNKSYRDLLKELQQVKSDIKTYVIKAQNISFFFANQGEKQQISDEFRTFLKDRYRRYFGRSLIKMYIPWIDQEWLNDIPIPIQRRVKEIQRNRGWFSYLSGVHDKDDIQKLTEKEVKDMVQKMTGEHTLSVVEPYKLLSKPIQRMGERIKPYTRTQLQHKVFEVVNKKPDPTDNEAVLLYEISKNALANNTGFLRRYFPAALDDKTKKKVVDQVQGVLEKLSYKGKKRDQ